MVDGPVRQASLREHNLALVLRQVATAAQPPSRADISAATSLTRATVSALVDDLIAGGLLAEVGPAPRTRAGRPAAGLVLARTGPAGLGLEVNIDYLAACVVDLAGAVRHQRVRRADQRPRHPTEVLADLAELAAGASAYAAREGLTLAGAAVAVPGLVDAGGLVRLAPNLGWRDVDVPGALALPYPLVVDNEANLAALGELHAGPPGPASFLYVSGEIGIGAGVVLNGALYRGARGWSGELGHVAVRPDGPACRCGAHGCLEQYAGQEAILRAAGADRAAAGEYGRGAGADGRGAGEYGRGAGADGRGAGADGRGAGADGIDDLVRRAVAGDPATCRALADAGTALGVAVAGVVNLLDVDTVVLGGVYAPLAPWLCPAVDGEIRRRVLTASWSPVAVRRSVLGADAAAVGAAGSVVREIHAHPAPWLAPTPY
ncbi:ROK family protein [Actinomycetes bacterium KLBMP 9797]